MMLKNFHPSVPSSTIECVLVAVVASILSYRRSVAIMPDCADLTLKAKVSIGACNPSPIVAVPTT